ncbi:MAG TPA: DUF3551 domain-containing protein [Pseudolabrys sp.]|nr:DUF3551 domain-containing protein [Pseudolabrys sp.]
MIRAAILAFAAVVTSFAPGAQPVQAREAPWCAVISTTDDSVYWDCQYNSFEQCRPMVLAGNRGWCNPNPYAAAAAQEKPAAKRRARPN